MTKKILCFAPHPDDELLGCGGSLIKAKNKGDILHICYMTLGENSNPKHSVASLEKIRKSESQIVCKEMGVKKKNVFYLGIKDNQISADDYMSFVKIINIIRTCRPDIVYLPHENENYYDHKQASILIQRSLDMAGSNNFINSKNKLKPWWVDYVLAYEVSTPLAKYQYAEDVSKEIESKIKLLNFYRSQTEKEGNLSDFIGEKAKYLPGYRAAMSVGEYREVFQVIRSANIL